MKILHAVEGLEKASGVSLFCVEMCNCQAAAGHSVTLVYKQFFQFKPASEVSVLKSDNLDDVKLVPDVVHLHGIWSIFCLNVLRWCRANAIKYIVSMHGCLMPTGFRRGYIKKWLFFNVFIKPLLDNVSFIHVTTSQEKKACIKRGLDKAYVIVPLGVDLPNEVAGDREGHKTVLFLSRVDKGKGVDMLIEAWKAASISDWRLVIAGPSWGGYREKMQKKVDDEHIENVEFVGAVFGEAKDALLRSADIFVLPSYSENFGSVVIEALSYGKPVIATKGTPWKTLVENQCGWWIDVNAKALARALMQSTSLSIEDRMRMGERGRQLVSEKYTWSNVADQVLCAYKQMLG